jgi:hypothetical protein
MEQNLAADFSNIDPIVGRRGLSASFPIFVIRPLRSRAYHGLEVGLCKTRTQRPRSAIGNARGKFERLQPKLKISVCDQLCCGLPETMNAWRWLVSGLASSRGLRE